MLNNALANYQTQKMLPTSNQQTSFHWKTASVSMAPTSSHTANAHTSSRGALSAWQCLHFLRKHFDSDSGLISIPTAGILHSVPTAEGISTVRYS